MRVRNEELKALLETDPDLSEARELALKIYCETWHGGGFDISSKVVFRDGKAYAVLQCPKCGRDISEVELKLKPEEVQALLADFKVYLEVVRMHIEGESEESIRAYVIARKLRPLEGDE